MLPNDGTSSVFKSAAQSAELHALLLASTDDISDLVSSQYAKAATVDLLNEVDVNRCNLKNLAHEVCRALAIQVDWKVDQLRQTLCGVLRDIVRLYIDRRKMQRKAGKSKKLVVFDKTSKDVYVATGITTGDTDVPVVKDLSDGLGKSSRVAVPVQTLEDRAEDDVIPADEMAVFQEDGQVVLAPADRLDVKKKLKAPAAQQALVRAETDAPLQVAIAKVAANAPSTRPSPVHPGTGIVSNEEHLAYKVGKGLASGAGKVGSTALWAGGKAALGAAAVGSTALWAGGKATHGAAALGSTALWAGGKATHGAAAVGSTALWAGGKAAHGAAEGAGLVVNAYRKRQERLRREREEEERRWMELRKRGLPVRDVPQSDSKYPEYVHKVYMVYGAAPASSSPLAAPIASKGGSRFFSWLFRKNKKRLPPIEELDDSEKDWEKPLSLTVYQKAAIRMHFPQSGMRNQLIYLAPGSGKTYTLLMIMFMRMQSMQPQHARLFKTLNKKNVYIEGAPEYPDFIMICTANATLVGEIAKKLLDDPVVKFPAEMRPFITALRAHPVSQAKNKEAAINTFLNRFNIYFAKYTSLVNMLQKNRLKTEKGFFILDECHVLLNPAFTQGNDSAGKQYQNILLREFVNPIHRGEKTMWGCVGLTATPYYQSYKDILKLYNIIMAGTPYRVDPAAFDALVENRTMDPAQFKELGRCVPRYRVTARSSEEDREVAQKAQVQTGLKKGVTARQINDVVFRKFQYGVFWVDVEGDQVRFAQRVVIPDHEVNAAEVDPEALPAYVRNTFYGASGRRDSMYATRIFTLPGRADQPGRFKFSEHPRLTEEELWVKYTGVEGNFRATRGEFKIDEVSPMVAQLVRLLIRRKGKTVIFCANPDSHGMNTVHELLSATSKLWLDPSCSLKRHLLLFSTASLEAKDGAASVWEPWPEPYPEVRDSFCTKGDNLEEGRSMCTKDPVDPAKRILYTFGCIGGEGKKSPVLCLGDRYFQGIDIKGAPGVPPPRSMIVLGETKSALEERQLHSRITRYCGAYDYPERSVDIYRLSSRVRGYQTCDTILSWYKANADRVSPMLLRLMESASLACPVLGMGMSCAGVKDDEIETYTLPDVIALPESTSVPLSKPPKTPRAPRAPKTPKAPRKRSTARSP